MCSIHVFDTDSNTCPKFITLLSRPFTISRVEFRDHSPNKKKAKNFQSKLHLLDMVFLNNDRGGRGGGGGGGGRDP